MPKVDRAPGRGDIVFIDFEPQAGREIRKRRPAVVLSPRPYNQASGLALMCPITSARKGYPFEVELPAGMATSGVVLADQVRSLDWRARRAELKEALPETDIDDVLGKLLTLLEP